MHVAMDFARCGKLMFDSGIVSVFIFFADAFERFSIKLSIVFYTKISSGNFNSGFHISSKNYLLQEPEISLRIFSNKVEFCIHFVALTPPQYKYICI
jgi:hypothetical protein